VLSARAVKDVPRERCWTERHQVGLLELPFAIVGGTIEVLAGQPTTHYDQRCTTVGDGTAVLGRHLRVSWRRACGTMSAPPGRTIAVNGYGEPLA